MTEKNWQTKCAELRERGAHLFRTKLWSDIVFRFKDHADHKEITIKAHRLIMAMASPVFAKMFYGKTGFNATPLLDVRPEIFQVLLEYMYTDNLHIPSPRDACDLYSAAKQWRLPYVMKECYTHLLTNTSHQNVCRIYEVACDNQQRVIVDACLQIFKTKTKDILCDPSFCQAKLDTVATIFGLDSLNIDSEMELFEAGVRHFLHSKEGHMPLNLLKRTQSNDETSSSVQDQSSVQEQSTFNIEDAEIRQCEPNCSENTDYSRNNTQDYSMDTDEYREDANKRKYRHLLTHIRFLTLSPREFAQCQNLDLLLTVDDMLAISLNIASKDTNIMMPEGFSDNPVPRCESRKEEVSRHTATFRSTIHSMRSLCCHESVPFYVRDHAWCFVARRPAHRADVVVMGVYCRHGAGEPPPWMSSVKARLLLVIKHSFKKLHLAHMNLGQTVGWQTEMKWDELWYPQSGFIEDNMLSYTVVVNARGSSRRAHDALPRDNQPSTNEPSTRVSRPMSRLDYPSQRAVVPSLDQLDRGTLNPLSSQSRNMITENMALVARNIPVESRNIPSATKNMLSVTRNVPSATNIMQSATNIMPSATNIMPTATNNMASATRNVPSETNNMASVTRNVPSETNNMASATRNVPSETNNVASATRNVPSETNNMASVNRNVASVTNNMASVTRNVPSVTNNIASATNNMPSVTNNMASATRNVPSETNNIASATRNVPSKTNNMAPATRNVPLATRNVPSAIRNVPSASKNMASATRNVPSETNNMESATRNVPSETNNMASATRNVTSATRNVPSATNIMPSAVNNMASAANTMASATNNMAPETRNNPLAILNIQNICSSSEFVNREGAYAKNPSKIHLNPSDITLADISSQRAGSKRPLPPSSSTFIPLPKRAPTLTSHYDNIPIINPPTTSITTSANTANVKTTATTSTNVRTHTTTLYTSCTYLTAPITTHVSATAPMSASANTMIPIASSASASAPLTTFASGDQILTSLTASPCVKSLPPLSTTMNTPVTNRSLKTYSSALESAMTPISATISPNFIKTPTTSLDVIEGNIVIPTTGNTQDKIGLHASTSEIVEMTTSTPKIPKKENESVVMTTSTPKAPTEPTQSVEMTGYMNTEWNAIKHAFVIIENKIDSTPKSNRTEDISKSTRSILSRSDTNVMNTLNKSTKAPAVRLTTINEEDIENLESLNIEKVTNEGVKVTKHESDQKQYMTETGESLCKDVKVNAGDVGKKVTVEENSTVYKTPSRHYSLLAQPLTPEFNVQTVSRISKIDEIKSALNETDESMAETVNGQHKTDTVSNEVESSRQMICAFTDNQSVIHGLPYHTYSTYKRAPSLLTDASSQGVAAPLSSPATYETTSSVYREIACEPWLPISRPISPPQSKSNISGPNSPTDRTESSSLTHQSSSSIRRKMSPPPIYRPTSPKRPKHNEIITEAGKDVQLELITNIKFETTDTRCTSVIKETLENTDMASFNTNDERQSLVEIFDITNGARSKHTANIAIESQDMKTIKIKDDVLKLETCCKREKQSLEWLEMLALLEQREQKSNVSNDYHKVTETNEKMSGIKIEKNEEMTKVLVDVNDITKLTAIKSESEEIQSKLAQAGFVQTTQEIVTETVMPKPTAINHDLKEISSGLAIKKELEEMPSEFSQESFVETTQEHVAETVIPKATAIKCEPEKILSELAQESFFENLNSQRELLVKKEALDVTPLDNTLENEKVSLDWMEMIAMFSKEPYETKLKDMLGMQKLLNISTDSEMLEFKREEMNECKSYNEERIEEDVATNIVGQNSQLTEQTSTIRDVLSKGADQILKIEPMQVDPELNYFEAQANQTDSKENETWVLLAVPACDNDNIDNIPRDGSMGVKPVEVDMESNDFTENPNVGKPKCLKSIAFEKIRIL